MVDFNLIRSRRRTISIEIHAHEVRVRAPTWASRSEIDSFVQSRTAWIAKHLNAQRERTPVPQRQYQNGETLPYLGHSLELQITSGRGPATFVPDVDILRVPIPIGSKQATIHAPLPARGETLDLFAERKTEDGVQLISPERAKIRTKIAAWYKAQALELMQQRSALYAAPMSVIYQRIRVAEFKRQWGSCGPGGVLSYNFLLLMAPLPIVDYIVVHELAHLRHANHGKRFWALVAKHYPDYMAARRWLRENHESLRL